MDIIHTANVFSAMSQETRLAALRILIRQGKQGMAAGLLSEKIGVPQNTLSFHLAYLRRVGLVMSRKEGRSIIYVAHMDAVYELIQLMLKDYCEAGKSARKRAKKMIQKL